MESMCGTEMRLQKFAMDADVLKQDDNKLSVLFSKAALGARQF
jgi:hypothetical protein